MALVVESLAITAVGGFVCLTFLLRCIWILTWIVTTRRSCWIATRNNFSRKGCCSCCRAFDLLGRIMKSCVMESTANLTSFLRWARLFVVFVAQAVCSHKLLWLTRLYRSPGEHNWYSGQVAMLCSCLHFSQDRFVLKVLFGTFCEVYGCFCWCVVDWQWEVDFVWLGLQVVRVDKLWGLRTDGSLIAFSTHFVVDLSLEL